VGVGVLGVGVEGEGGAGGKAVVASIPASFANGDGGITGTIFSGGGAGPSSAQNPRPTLMAPIRIIPPVTGSQYRRCLRENGAARSFATLNV
jgi:hypothetical protein